MYKYTTYPSENGYYPLVLCHLRTEQPNIDNAHDTYQDYDGACWYCWSGYCHTEAVHQVELAKGRERRRD